MKAAIRLIVALGAVGGGWLLGSALPVHPVAAVVGQPEGMPGAAALVSRLESLAPFGVVAPEFDKSGAVVENVGWTERFGDEFSFDIWYRTADGMRIHLWESSVHHLREKDPTIGGEPQLIGRQAWTLLDLPDDAIARYSLATRTSAGVTISFDTSGPSEALIQAAAALAIP